MFRIKTVRARGFIRGTKIDIIPKLSFDSVLNDFQLLMTLIVVFGKMRIISAVSKRAWTE